MAAEDLDTRLDQIVRARVKQNASGIEHSLRQIAAGNPLGSEPSAERLTKRIARKTNLSIKDATAVCRVIERAAAVDDRLETGRGPEAIQGPTIDFTGVEFLSRGRRAASAVGRIVRSSGAPRGTGFMVAPGLLLTNNHVIASPDEASGMVVQFDYEMDDNGVERPVTVFGFDAATFFLTDPIDRLDYTLVAVGARLRGTRSLDEFGYLPLSDAQDKHALGEIANIIQHPEGKHKQIVVRDNNLVSRDETVQVLHYLADTLEGASGATVCNNEWEPIAIHHWAGPALEITGTDGLPLRQDINEGIRISAIVKDIAARIPTSGTLSGALADLIQFWKSVPRRSPIGAAAPERAALDVAEPETGPRISSDGTITWVFPIEISVRAPLLDRKVPTQTTTPATIAPAFTQPERTGRASTDFGNRGGYEPGFLAGFVVPLPALSNIPYNLANNKEASEGEDPHELRYTHFSIFMNRDRKLAALTACNIDGARTVAVNRSTKVVTHNPTLGQLGVEAIGAEATDDFQPDPRIEQHEQMAREFYEDQRVPGFDKPAFPGKDATDEARKQYARAMSERTARMFQKGHIIMRGDPAWGMDGEATAAEADTFFYTNAAPQLGFFNQGSADNRPGSKGVLRWRAVETYILRNAVTMRQRISVFAGPIFDDETDIPYRHDTLLPTRFWKVAVWAEGRKLRSVGLIADQRPVLEKLTKGIPEAFPDEAELGRVSEFQTTVKKIEALTKLDFGDGVRAGDIRAGKARDVPLVDLGPEALR